MFRGGMTIHFERLLIYSEILYGLDYKDSSAFEGQNVLVVGSGNMAIEILADLV